MENNKMIVQVKDIKHTLRTKGSFVCLYNILKGHLSVVYDE